MTLLPNLLILFIGLPIIELALLLKLHEYIGWSTTIAIVILTGVAGAALVRQQGIQTLLEIRREAACGNVPAGRLVDGLLILISGAFLITPGLLTDTAGFLLLVPPLRALLKRRISKWIAAKIASGQIHFIHY